MRPLSTAMGLILACGLIWGILFGITTGPRADDPVGRLSLSVNFGVSSFEMGDVNREIGRGNDDFFRVQNFATMDKLSYGFGFLADFKTAISDPFFISLGFGNLRGQTGVSFNEIVDVSSKANMFYGRLLYALPWRPLESSRLFVGGGPLILKNVELEVSHERDEVAKKPERKEIMTFTGDGAGFQVDVLGEYLLSDHVTVALNAGYRGAAADLNEWTINVRNADTLRGTDLVKDDAQVWWSSYLIDAFLEDPGENDPEDRTDGPPISTLEAVDDLSADFSGFRIEVGLRMYFF